MILTRLEFQTTLDGLAPQLWHVVDAPYTGAPGMQERVAYCASDRAHPRNGQGLAKAPAASSGCWLWKLGERIYIYMYIDIHMMN